MSERSNKDYEKANFVSDGGSEEERGDDRLPSEIKEEFEDEPETRRLLPASDHGRTFRCDVCWKGFTRSEYVVAHKRYIHSDTRPFACDLCAKAFKSNNDLKRHRQTHSVDKDRMRRSRDSSSSNVALPGSVSRKRRKERDGDWPRRGSGVSGRKASRSEAADDACLKIQPVVTLEQFTPSPAWRLQEIENKNHNSMISTAEVEEDGRLFSLRSQQQQQAEDDSAYLHLEVEEIDDDFSCSDVQSVAAASNDLYAVTKSKEDSESFAALRERRKCETGDDGGAATGEERKKNSRCRNCREVFESKTSMLRHKETCTETCYVEVEGASPSSAPSFECKQCGRRCATRDSVLSHRRTYHATKNLKCRYCGRAYAFRSQLRLHEAAHEKRADTRDFAREFPVERDRRGRAFETTTTTESAKKRVRHFRRDDDERPFQCYQCSKSFKVAYDLRRHLERHSSTSKITVKTRRLPPLREILPRRDPTERCYVVVEGTEPFECKECGKRFKTPKNVLDHRRAVHARKELKCKDSDKAFAFRRQLKSHEAVHDDDDDRKSDFSCDLCGKAFRSADGVKSHKRYFHCDERPFHCYQCGKSFKVAYDLKRHLECHSTRKTGKRLSRLSSKCYDDVDGPLPYKCKACGKPYERLAALYLHTRIHHAAKEFECRHCGRRFALRCDLKDHLVAHEGGYSLRCDECGRAFKWRQALARHRKYAHTDERPFMCDRCPKSLKCGRDLLKHASSMHSEERPRRGSGTGRSVEPEDPSSMTAPSKKQTKKKSEISRPPSIERFPFRCDVCGKGFSRAENVVAHVRYVHSDDRPYACDRCSKSFESGHDLRRHRQTHSAKETTTTRPSTGDELHEDISSLDVPATGGALRLSNSVPETRKDTGSPLDNERVPPEEEEPSVSEVDRGPTPTLFRCQHCGKRFKKRRSLSIHVRLRHAEKTLKSKRREKAFALKYDPKAARVVSSHGGDSTVRCNECGKVSERKTSLRAHLKLAHSTADGGSYVCAVCSKSFLFSSHLKIHARSHLTNESDAVDVLPDGPPTDDTSLVLDKSEQHSKPGTENRPGERSYKCDICHVPLASKQLFWSHKKLHHPGEESYVKVDGPSPYKCKQCGKRFKESRYIYSHIRACHMKKELKCKHCDKAFAMNYQLKLHTVVHEGERCFQCDICGDAFKRKYGLLSHRIYVHADHDKLFICNLCGKPLTSISGLRRHMAIHSENDVPGTRRNVLPWIRPGEKCYVELEGPVPFKCRACDKKYANLPALYMHFRMHHMQKGFKCKYCEKRFALKAEWKEHEVVHEDRYSYQCGECDRFFKWRQALARHRKYAHSTERPYLCDRCTKSYISHYDLMRHVDSSHLDKRPYVCRQCGKAFKNPSHLSRHRKRHPKNETASEEVEDDLASVGKTRDGHGTLDPTDFETFQNADDLMLPDDENVVYAECIQEFPENAVLFEIDASEMNVLAPRTTEGLRDSPLVIVSYGSDFPPASGETSEHSVAIETALPPRRTEIVETFAAADDDVHLTNLLRSGQNILFQRMSGDSRQIGTAAPDDRRAEPSGRFRDSIEHQDCAVETRYSATPENSPFIRGSYLPTQVAFRVSSFPNSDQEATTIRRGVSSQSTDVQTEKPVLQSQSRRPVVCTLLYEDTKCPSSAASFSSKDICRAVEIENCDDSYAYSEMASITDMQLQHDDVSEDKAPKLSIVSNAELIGASEFREIEEYEDLKQAECFRRVGSLQISVTTDEESAQNKQKNDVVVDKILTDDIGATLLNIGAEVKQESMDYSDSLMDCPATNDTAVAVRIRQHNDVDDECKAVNSGENRPAGRVYKCNICRKTFASRKLVASHKKLRHSGEKSYVAVGGRGAPYECKRCGKRFKDKRLVFTHIRACHAKKEFKCKHCEKVFGLRSQLKRHTLVHVGEYPFTCDICGKAFRGRFQLDRHGNRAHSDERSYCCHQCNKTVRSISALRKHLDRHMRDKSRVRDPKCYVEIEFDPKEKCYVEVEGLKPFQCKFCPKKYKRSETVAVHVRRDHRKRQIKCKFCGNGFASANELKEHVSAVHVDEFSFQCDICGKAFDKKSNLLAHGYYFHSDQRPYVCDECGKAFKSRYDLGRHLTGHSESNMISAKNVSSSESKPVRTKYPPRPPSTSRVAHLGSTNPADVMKWRITGKVLYVEKNDGEKIGTPNDANSVSDCHAKITNSSRDDEVVRRVDGLRKGIDGKELQCVVRQFICDICFEKLASKAMLQSHKDACHPNEKSYVEVDGPLPYKCKMCDTRLKEIKYVTTHVRCCHMAKEFKCEHCPKVFGLRYRLKLHMRKHETKSSHQCDECGRIFTRKAGLTLHRKSRHPVVEDKKIADPDETASVFACDQCGKSLPSLSSLRSHMRYHVKRNVSKVLTDDQINLALQDPRLICKYESEYESGFPETAIKSETFEGATPPSESTLASNHLPMEELPMKQRNKLLWKSLIIRTESPTPFTCRLCNKRCKSRSAIMLHVRFSHMKKEFECDVCGKQFALQYELIDHGAVHEDRYSFQCDVCGVAFKWRQALNRHKKCSHPTGSPCFCDQCQKSFTCHSLLKIHVSRVHRKDRPYVCPICDKAYKFPSHLTRHRKNNCLSINRPSSRLFKKRRHF